MPKPLGHRPPEYLGRVAKECWKRLTGAMVAGVFTAVDREMIEAYCMCYEQMRRAYVEGFMKSRSVKGEDGKMESVEPGMMVMTPKGFEVPSPYNSQVRAYAEMLKKIGSELGLSPAARARLHVAAIGDGNEEIDEAWLAAGGGRVVDIHGKGA